MSRIRRFLALAVYYFLGVRMPSAGVPWNGIAFRRFLCRGIFLSVGKNVNIAAGVRFGRGANISIGDNSGLGENSFLVCMDKIEIGDDVMVGPQVMMLTGGHAYDDPDKRLIDQSQIIAPIKIGNDVWIGARAIILPGVTIGDRVVIGAGAVVTKDMPSRSVCAGVPCKVLKRIS